MSHERVAILTKDGDFPVDAGGKLSSGESFAAAGELTGIFADKKRDTFIRNICEKMLTYSLGRGTERYDRPAIDKMMQQMAAGDNRFSALVLAVVKSVPFDMQRADHAAVAAAP